LCCACSAAGIWYITANPPSEAKKKGAIWTALPQLIIYLAAIQDARKRAGKKFKSAFGLITDGSWFQFAFLDDSRKLFVSRVKEWVSDKMEIIKWIDKILEDAIKASPRTSPTQKPIMDPKTYEAELRWWYMFGLDSDDEDLVEVNHDQRYGVLSVDGLLVTRQRKAISDSESEEDSLADWSAGRYWIRWVKLSGAGPGAKPE
jgi:hypothetical protein